MEKLNLKEAREGLTQGGFTEFNKNFDNLPVEEQEFVDNIHKAVMNRDDKFLNNNKQQIIDIMDKLEL